MSVVIPRQRAHPATYKDRRSAKDRREIGLRRASFHTSKRVTLCRDEIDDSDPDDDVPDDAIATERRVSLTTISQVTRVKDVVTHLELSTQCFSSINDATRENAVKYGSISHSLM